MSHEGYHDARMPGPTTRFVAGIAATLALGGCSALQDATAPEPSGPASQAAVAPTPSGPPWAQDLAFSGDLTGRMTGVVPNQPGQRSQCTGANSKAAGNWASTIYGQVGSGVYGLVITATPYRGPGTYAGGVATVEVNSADQKQVWQSQMDDSVAFVVNNDEQSGRLDATLTNLSDGKSKLRVTGSWSCRT